MLTVCYGGNGIQLNVSFFAPVNLLGWLILKNSSRANGVLPSVYPHAQGRIAVNARIVDRLTNSPVRVTIGLIQCVRVTLFTGGALIRMKSVLLIFCLINWYLMLLSLFYTRLLRWI